MSGDANANDKAATTSVPLVPLRLRWVVAIEILMVLVPLLYIFAGWHSNG